MSVSHVICVTGATAGVGLATARRFLKEGWRVIAMGRRHERLGELAKEAGGYCLPLTVDVRDKAEVFKAFASLQPPFASIDVLVNNAGSAQGIELAQNAVMENWEVIIDTNVKGVMYCTAAVLPGLVARGSGHVVNISSIGAAGNSYPGSNVYGASKAFVSRFSQNLRTDLHGTRVRVTSIEPGKVESEFSLARFKGDVKKAGEVYAGFKSLQPEDLADIIFYVISTPPHVDISRLEVISTDQSDAGSRYFKGP
jgi:NADP-dependent 3-hydroxy acid dehydrogenase YdfG